MIKTKENREYVPHFPAAKEDTRFNLEFKPVLITSLGHFNEIKEINKGKKVIAVDTETTGLDYLTCKIVGICFSFDAYSGYYIPLRHKVGENIILPDNMTVEAFIQYFYTSYISNPDMIALFFNAIYDLFMFGIDGCDKSIARFFDVMVLVFNADNTMPEKNLKFSSKHYLGRSPNTFEETVGGKVKFDSISPEDGLYYATCDSSNTYGLYQKLMPILSKECPHVIKMDNNLVKSMLFYMEQPVYINKDKMIVLAGEVEAEKKALELKIFDFFGMHFNLNCVPGTNTIDRVAYKTGKVVKNLPVQDLFKDFASIDSIYTPIGFQSIHCIGNTGLKTVYKIHLENNTIFECSEDHLLLVNRQGSYEFVPAKSLLAGDDILSVNDEIDFLMLEDSIKAQDIIEATTNHLKIGP